MKPTTLLQIAAMVVLTCAAGLAAADSGTVTGVVTVGGLPAGRASVTLSNEATHYSQTVASDSLGVYLIAKVPSGDGYQLVAKAASGDTARTKVSVAASRTVTVSIEIGAEGVGKNATAASPSPDQAVKTLTRSDLQALPLFDRSYNQMAAFVPGAHDATGEKTSSSFSYAGKQPGTQSVNLDGIPIGVSGTNNAGITYLNDAIQEFSVRENPTSAEIAQATDVRAISQRGGNSFHGSAFGLFNSEAMNWKGPLSAYNGSTFDQAAAYAGSTSAAQLPFNVAGYAVPTNYDSYVATAGGNFDCTDGTGAICNTLFDPSKAPISFDRPLSQQQFGANAGGAIVRDRFFAFASYEGRHLDNPTPIFERVPSAWDRTYDPFATSAFGFGADCVGCNPSGDASYGLDQSILSYFPLSNVNTAAMGAVPNALEFYRGTAPNHSMTHAALLRADIIQSGRQAWSVRYALNRVHELHDDTLPSGSLAGNGYPGNGANRDVLNQNLLVSFRSNFTANVVNDIRFGWNRMHYTETPQDAGFDAAELRAAGLSQVPTIFLSGIDPQLSGQTPGSNGAMPGWSDSWDYGNVGLMYPTLDGLFPMVRLGAPMDAPGAQKSSGYYLNDSASWIHGRHDLRWGLGFQYDTLGYYDGAFARGFMYSGNIGEFTSDAESCNEACGQAFLSPTFDYIFQNARPFQDTLRNFQVNWFVEDTWRLNRRFSLSYGLRWDYFSVPSSDHESLWNYDPVANGLVKEGSTAVVDPFGYACGSGVGPNYDGNGLAWQQNSIQWNCQVAGSGRVFAGNTLNFAPRIGMAWDITGTGRTVLHAGVGMFYDRIPLSSFTHLMFNQPQTLTNPNLREGRIWAQGACALNADCSYGSYNTLTSADPSLQSVPSPFGVSAMDLQHSNQPRVVQINASLQHEVASKLSVEIGYFGTLGRNLPVIHNSNFEQEWGCANEAKSIAQSVLAPVYPAECDNFEYVPIMTMSEQAQSSYQSLVAKVHIGEWHGLRISAGYVLSRSIDNTPSNLFPIIPITLQDNATYNYLGFGNVGDQNGNPTMNCIVWMENCNQAANDWPATTGMPSLPYSTAGGAPLTTPYTIGQNPLDYLINDRGTSDFNSTHRFTLDYVWSIPTKSASRWLSGWGVSGTFIAQSGQPYTLYSEIGGELTQRVSASGPIATSSRPNAAINSTNIVLPSAACLADPTHSPFVDSSNGLLYSHAQVTPCTGTTGRNAFTGPAYANMNLGVSKSFRIFGEGHTLNFRADFFNLFGNDNLYNPISLATTDGFTPNPQFGRIKSAHSPRQIEIGVRFNW